MDLIGTLFTFVGLVGAVVVFVVIAVVTAFDHSTPQRLRGLWWWLAACLAVVVFGCVLMFGPAISEDFTRSRDLTALDENSKPLIAAIREFERSRARSPSDLRELVPEFLPVEPMTGLSRWPHYDYYFLIQHPEQGWVLDVWIPKTWFDLDGNRRFLYEPDARKDAALGATLRAGDWVYIPD